MVTVTPEHGGYTDMGGVGGVSVDIPGYPWQVTVSLAYMERGIVGLSLDYPWMVTVTLPSVDTLTWGKGEGGWTSLDYP